MKYAAPSTTNLTGGDNGYSGKKINWEEIGVIVIIFVYGEYLTPPTSPTSYDMDSSVLCIYSGSLE